MKRSQAPKPSRSPVAKKYRKTSSETEVAARKRTGRIQASSRALAREITRRRRTETLVGLQRDVALHLAAATTIEIGLSRCLETVFQVPELECGGIYLAEDDGTLTLAAHAGLSDTFVAQVRCVPPDSERAAAILGGTPHYYAQSRPLSGPEEGRLLASEGIRAVAALPINYSGQVIGCMNIASRSCNRLPPTVRHLIEGVASQIGAAVARLKSEELLHIKDQAIAASPYGVAITDMDGRITYSNDAALRMWGYASVEETLGRSLFDFWDDRKLMENVVAELRQLRGSIGETEAIREDGSRFPVEFSATPVLDHHGNPRAMMGSFLDISARRRAEEAARNADRLRMEAERFLAAGRMAATVAHEINNPLAGITNCFQLVKQAIRPGHPYTKFASLIEDELARIARIVLQMHELSRPDQGAVEATRVRGATDVVATMLAPMCRQNNVRIEADIQPHNLMLNLPRGLLNQVLYNLLVNAVEASPEGGDIRINADLWNGRTRITVRDYGGGVPTHVRDEIFEPFYSTKGGGSPGGLGLGLYLSKQLVCSAGGELCLVPTAGRGATFRILLPQPDS